MIKKNKEKQRVEKQKKQVGNKKKAGGIETRRQKKINNIYIYLDYSYYN